MNCSAFVTFSSEIAHPSLLQQAMVVRIQLLTISSSKYPSTFLIFGPCPHPPDFSIRLKHSVAI